MAAPTQVYPPWLTPEPFTVTQNGVVTVETSIVQFPQTYYGPSIPLGPDWVFGGSTFPASIATSFPAPSDATPTFSTSVVPTESATTPTTTPSSQSQTTASASSSVSSPTTSTPTSTSSSSTPTSSASAAPGASHGTSGLSSGSRLAIILSTILVTLLLLVLIFVVIRFRRRARRSRSVTSGGGMSWTFIHGNGSSPHHNSGEGEDDHAAAEEGTAFLTPDQGTEAPLQGPAFISAWPRPPSTAPQPRPASEQPDIPEPIALAAESRPGTAKTKSDSSTLDSEAKREDIARFNASSSTADVGSLFYTPGRGLGEGSGTRRSDEAEEQGLVASVTAALGSQPRNYATRPPGAAAPAPPRLPTRSSARPIVTTPTALYFSPTSPRAASDDGRVYESDVQRLTALRARESLEEDAELRPPRPLDPDHTLASQPSSSGSRGSWSYPESPPSETDERATLLTARRVNLGQTAQPVLRSSPTKKNSLEGWVTPPNEEEERPPVVPRTWSVTMGGLAELAKGLGRFSWFRRMDSEAGPSGTRHSSSSHSRHNADSRPPSMVGLAGPGLVSRPQSGLLRPPFGSRPQSGVSFRSIDAELGLRPPGVRASAAGSGSGGSGSGKSGATVYHSVSSRPRTPHYTRSAEHISHEAHIAFPEPMLVALPPDVDFGEGSSTVRSVDVLDLPVPERSLPFGPPVLPDTSSRSTRHGTMSSKETTSGATMAFPPGLVSVSKWDGRSHSDSSRQDVGDVLEDEPPQAGGDWNSLRSKGSANDMQEEGGGSRRRGRPITRSSTGELAMQQAVQVITGEPATSETASIATGPRQPSTHSASGAALSPRSLGGFGLTLTPRVSFYASSQSDIASHSGNGSYSSHPSRYTSHSQAVSQQSSNQDSEDGVPPMPGHGFNRASLSAIGGEQGQGPPQLPPMRPLSNMQPMLERTSEDRETEGSDSSRPGTETNKAMSEPTRTGTFAPGAGSTGVQTTVASDIESTPKQ